MKAKRRSTNFRTVARCKVRPLGQTGLAHRLSITGISQACGATTRRMSEMAQPANEMLPPGGATRPAAAATMRPTGETERTNRFEVRFSEHIARADAELQREREQQRRTPR